MPSRQTKEYVTKKAAYPEDGLKFRLVAVGKFQRYLGFANTSSAIDCESPQSVELLVSKIGVDLIDLSFSPVESLDPGLW